MKFTCPSCQTKSLSIFQKSIAGRFLNVTCPNCQAVLYKKFTLIWIVWMTLIGSILPVLLLGLLFYPPTWPFMVRLLLIVAIMMFAMFTETLISRMGVKTNND